MTLTKKLGIVFFTLLVVAIANTSVVYNFQTSQKTDAAIIDAAGRNRMLSQKIGFLAEQIVNGNESIKSELQEVIYLHDTSFLALKNGGIAPGISNNRTLPETIPSIMPLVENAGELWLKYKANAEVIANKPIIINEIPNPAVITALSFIEKNALEMLNRNNEMTKAYVISNEIKQKSTNGALFIILIIYAIVIGFGFIVSRSLVHTLEVLDKAKTNLVSLIAHQLKTPITAISWNTETLLSGDHGALNPEQTDTLNQIDNTNGRMKKLINSFLNISNIDLGVVTIKTKTINFIDVCEEALNGMEPQILEKNHTIIKKYDKKSSIAPADQNLLRIIFENLISNAIKYTPENGEITISIGALNHEITLSVSNGGNPITKEDQSKIFDKLYRTDDAQKMDPDGNGLGLYLVKKIVKNAGGRIWIESKKGSNTIFSVAFPITGMKEREGIKSLS